MQGYKEPGFQDRRNAAEQERSKALARLKAAPGVDPAVAVERAAKQAEREAAQAEKRARTKPVRERRAVTVEKSPNSDGAQTPVQVTGRTEEERKAARDARYAARKARRK